MKALAAVCLLAARAWAGEYTGFISDASCGAKNANLTKESQECARACVKGGSAPVFVTEKEQKLYRISDKAKVLDHVGEKVVLTGTIKGDTIEVSSLKPVK